MFTSCNKWFYITCVPLQCVSLCTTTLHYHVNQTCTNSLCSVITIFLTLHSCVHKSSAIMVCAANPQASSLPICHLIIAKQCEYCYVYPIVYAFFDTVFPGHILLHVLKHSKIKATLHPLLIQCSPQGLPGLPLHITDASYSQLWGHTILKVTSLSIELWNCNSKSLLFRKN